MAASRRQGTRLLDSTSRPRSIAGALLAAAVIAFTPGARAQSDGEGLALSRFDPAPAGDRMFGVASPYVAGHLAPHVMLLADYAHDPLVVRSAADDEVVGAVVSDQLTLHLDGALALWNRLLVDVDVPLVIVQSGDDPSQAGQSFQSPSGAALGDLRFGARVRVLGDYHDAFQAALGAQLWLPTGASGSYVSDARPRAMPQAIVGGRLPELVWSFAIGPELRRTQEFATVTQGTMLRWGGGVGFLLMDGRLQVGPELSGAMVLDEIDGRAVNMEVLLDGRYRVLPDVEAGLGVGPGLTGGVGTPDVRVVAMAAYSPEQQRAPDRDADGISDPKDACPAVPGVESEDPAKNGCPPPLDQDRDGVPDAEDACRTIAGVESDDPKKNGCPPADRDRDGILDVHDACAAVPGLPSEDPAKNGCPPDKDQDGIPDGQDACPEYAGPPNADPTLNGCPPDRDHDGIPDAYDTCPEEKGFPSADLDKNGCPKTVRVTASEVQLLQQVQFDTDRATLKAVSDPILDEVAQVLKEHPEILSVEVQGHTDERGSKLYNKRLSQRRAEAVKQALVARGIDGDKLTPKGYGREVPLEDNTTDEGRQKNRRVEFKIVQKSTRKP
ncbi:MAG: OmpA family protein [Polyangiaceae bacterium]|nr:OmpA family protein [Polyangiaceae bacterium]